MKVHGLVVKPNHTNNLRCTHGKFNFCLMFFNGFISGIVYEKLKIS